jgi:hypothetical protein
MRQFSVGEVVTWIPDLLLRSETHGDYRIVAAMPDRDGDHMLRGLVADGGRKPGLDRMATAKSIGWAIYAAGFVIWLLGYLSVIAADAKALI